MMKIINKILPLMLLTGSLTACDMLDIQPVGQVIPTTLAEYRALLATAYKKVPSDRGLTGFRTDEMFVRKDSWDLEKYRNIESWNDYAAAGTTASFEWAAFYSSLFSANYVIEQQEAITQAAPDDLRQLVGEAYLLRAYLHFQLVNLYGQPYTKPGAPGSKSIPLKLNSDINEVLARNTVAEVYASILSDVAAAGQRINKEEWEVQFSYRFNRLSVEAFLARIHLYMGHWAEACQASEAVLARKPALEDFNAAAEAFRLPNHYQSVEAINALELVMTSNYNTAANASPALLSLYRTGDLRPALYFKADKKGDMKSLKGGKDTFHSTFRTGELYLIAAEASARLGNLAQSRTRLLQLVQKRYTPQAYAVKAAEVAAMGQEQLVDEVLGERARELAFEGHRWFDLRRTTRPQLTKVLDGKSFTLSADDVRYTLLIPREAIAANPGLAGQ